MKRKHTTTKSANRPFTGAILNYGYNWKGYAMPRKIARPAYKRATV